MPCRAMSCVSCACARAVPRPCDRRNAGPTYGCVWQVVMARCWVARSDEHTRGSCGSGCGLAVGGVCGWRVRRACSCRYTFDGLIYRVPYSVIDGFLSFRPRRETAPGRREGPTKARRRRIADRQAIVPNVCRTCIDGAAHHIPHPRHSCVTPFNVGPLSQCACSPCTVSRLRPIRSTWTDEM